MGDDGLDLYHLCHLCRGRADRLYRRLPRGLALESRRRQVSHSHHRGAGLLQRIEVLMIPEVPTGNTPEIVQQYYQYLLDHYINPVTQNVTPNYFLEGVTLGWVLIITGLIFIYFRRVRNEKPGKLYPVETYNGYISESNGGVGVFLLVFFGLVVVWVLWITISNLTQGQLY